MRLFPKLAIVLSLALIGSVLLGTGLFYWAEGEWIRKDEHAKQQLLLQSLTQIAEESIVTNDDLLLVKFTKRLQEHTPELLTASVTDMRGHIRSHSEPKRIGHSTAMDPAPSSALLLSQPIQFGSHFYGTATVTFSQKILDAKLDAQLKELKKRLMPMFGVLLAINLLLVFWLSLSWTRPIKTIVHGTEEIGRGNWHVSLAPLDSRGDELGDVSRAIHSMAQQLGELDEMKEDFVTAVTHELRSPLGAITSFLDLMENDKVKKGMPRTWDEYHNRIGKNVLRLTRFINDLLDVAALDRGKVKFNPQSVDLVPIVRQTFELFESTFVDKHLKATMDVPESCPAVMADPEKIAQVLVNLVSNAIKFTPKRGEITVRIEPREDDRTVLISVCDTGIGIREEDQARIFNKFEQVKSARLNIKGPKGTGLGLAISRALIEMHSAELKVRSAWGKGSAFHFALPICQMTQPLVLHG